MKYKILEKENNLLKVKDLKIGDYFKFLGQSSINNDENVVYKLIETYTDNRNLYALSYNDNTSYCLINDLENNISKVKPIKIEDNIIYFEVY